ncbi:MAG: antitoxin [Verrucomicrobia bacterium]|nr:antitoxin [Verrucomicrobiota bacterium]MCH8513402.1 ribbon-helix-helix domain-containing protein [Kiritimatiellia bacterium]
MIRTQIQLPDDIYKRAKSLSRKRQVSLAELTRRGLEYMLSVYPEGPEDDTPWNLPAPKSLGWKDLTDEELKRAAQEPSAERLP